MKHERIDKLIDIIREGVAGVAFDMRSWHNPCRECESGCIAFHAVVAAEGIANARVIAALGQARPVASRWLGLSFEQAASLFSSDEERATSREWAVTRLQELKLQDA